MRIIRTTELETRWRNLPSSCRKTWVRFNGVFSFPVEYVAIHGEMHCILAQ